MFEDSGEFDEHEINAYQEGVAVCREEFTTDGTDDTDKKRAVRIHFPSV
jgi:hypothetical protein